MNKSIIDSIFSKTNKRCLYLGCGDKYIDNFVNIDISSNSKADIIADVTKLEDFDEYSIDLIYTCHMLEHISRHIYKDILKLWYNILKKEGTLRISVPDLYSLAKYYVENKNIDEVRGCIYGGQRNEYDYHYFGYDFDSLKKDLEELGFKDVKRFDWRDLDYDIKDWSRDYLPKHYSNGKIIPDEEWYRGTLVSLNIEATK